MKTNFDVVLVGGGVIGSAVARELSRYKLSICVLEKELDVCNGTSGRNTGLLHSGILHEKGTLRAIWGGGAGRTPPALRKADRLLRG